ncbi:hypothetical protein [Streptomyces diastaticus]|uniref:hypothetical protein n=1 Tax=Streptomyces diastaticus TaxID=1956 RepID=UPI0036591DCB
MNHRPRLWSASEAAEVLRPLARDADLVIASDDELALVADPAAHSSMAANRAWLRRASRDPKW